MAAASGANPGIAGRGKGQEVGPASPAAGAEPPFQPADGILDGPNFAELGSVDGLHRDKFDPVTGESESEKGFGFDFEMVGSDGKAGLRAEVQETEAALGVGDGEAEESLKAAAHPAIHVASQERHAFLRGHAVADHEGGAGEGGTIEEGGDILGTMLSVPIEG